MLEEHADWGETARNAGLLAAVLAIGAAALVSRPTIGRLFSILTAFVAIGAAYAVIEAGHFGGELVYRHGAGVAPATAGASYVAPVSFKQEYGREEKHDDD